MKIEIQLKKEKESHLPKFVYSISQKNYVFWIGYVNWTLLGEDWEFTKDRW